MDTNTRFNYIVAIIILRLYNDTKLKNFTLFQKKEAKTMVYCKCHKGTLFYLLFAMIF
jgi:hypothetical protein